MNAIEKQNNLVSARLSPSFWVLWSVELWERFGYYGVQAIFTFYFVKSLGYSEAESFSIFGAFSGLTYGFIWIGGWIGDQYLGAKPTLLWGAVVLASSYAGLAFANAHTVFFALSGVVIGNALFKANPGSLIAKIITKGPALDGAMTYYYMAINIGSIFSMSITPIVAQHYGPRAAFLICFLGLLLGLANYLVFRKLLAPIGNLINKTSSSLKRFFVVALCSILSIGVVSFLLQNHTLSNLMIGLVVISAFFYFLKIAFSLKGTAKKHMLVAFVLIAQAVLFAVLYNQMPTSLTFFALHNVDNNLWGWAIPPAEYQVLNSLVIVLFSPLLACLYRKIPATHVTKFAIGMTLCATAFLVLTLPPYFSNNGLISPGWIVLTYFLQSVGELLISALGLPMVAALCPEERSGFVMGVWFLSYMLAGPIAAWVASFTALPTHTAMISRLESLQTYSHVFGSVGALTALVAALMWIARPWLNRVLESRS